VSVFKRKTMLGTHTLQYSPLIFQLSYERRQIAVKWRLQRRPFHIQSFWLPPQFIRFCVHPLSSVRLQFEWRHL